MGKGDFGSRIRKLRMDNGYSMQELADKVGVTKSSINMWENGSSIPNDRILIVLSKFFDVSIDYLLGNEQMEKKRPENKTLHYIQRNLEKMDEQKLKQAEKVLQAVFMDIFEDSDDDDDDI
ncbi:MAG: helix-turn-helix transcriptional regulator [Clostridia bacterium]|nr:helix-turn-helix transcriptional regulator [Clostridia bacterium]